MQINIKMSPQSVIHYLPNPLPSPLSKSCDPYLTLKADEHGEVLPVIAVDNTVTQQGQLFLHFLHVKRQTRYRLSCAWEPLCALSAVRVYYYTTKFNEHHSHLFNQNGGHILFTLVYNELLQATSNLQVICNGIKWA